MRQSHDEQDNAPAPQTSGSLSVFSKGEENLRAGTTAALSKAVVINPVHALHITQDRSQLDESHNDSPSISALGRIRDANAASTFDETASVRSLRSIRSYATISPSLSHNDRYLLQSIFGSDDVTEDVAPEGLQSSADTACNNLAGEFEPVDEETTTLTEGHIRNGWFGKKKHFFIMSAAGKPIYSRHESSRFVPETVAILQTLISAHLGENGLKTFTAGACHFAVLDKHPLYLIAISRLAETGLQLRAQLDALYSQILSTLSLPNLEHIFSHRPSTDLKAPLQGTESLLSSLSDSFTRGSPSVLLTAVECLMLRSTHRREMNDALLGSRSDELLYGLIVAGGRLVNVIRPQKHSLHPNDLQLIFNMLFETHRLKAGGGENWIPICLPCFNKNGFLYMYVSFLGESDIGDTAVDEDPNYIIVILLSASKDSFFSMKQMRNRFVKAIERRGSIGKVKAAMNHGRPLVADIVPGTVINHFLYKSKTHVQFLSSSYEPYFSTANSRRQLFSIYQQSHGVVRTKTSDIKIHFCISDSMACLAWTTDAFEIYCVAERDVPRNTLALNASAIVQWIKHEEEQLFIIGGAIF